MILNKKLLESVIEGVDNYNLNDNNKNLLLSEIYIKLIQNMAQGRNKVTLIIGDDTIKGPGYPNIKVTFDLKEYKVVRTVEDLKGIITDETIYKLRIK